jgi:hypothetical protein
MSWFDLYGRDLISEVDWTKETASLSGIQDLRDAVLLRVDKNEDVVRDGDDAAWRALAVHQPSDDAPVS